MSATRSPVSYRSSRFYLLALSGWVALTLTAILVALNVAIGEIESDFLHESAEAAVELRQKMQVSESVLNGFSAFLYAVESGDRSATTRYASAATSPYAHLYMLEVARQVSSADRPAFEAEMQRAWDAGFSLRDFAYQGARRWQDVQAKASYWPLVFLFPEQPEVMPLYGLDLDSVALLAEPLREAWRQKAQTASPPFRLMEGEPAYVLFQSVQRPAARNVDDARRTFGGLLTALLVIKTSALLPSHLDHRDQVRADFVLADRATLSSTPPLFVRDADPVSTFDTMLPKLQREMNVSVGPQHVQIAFSRQLRWVDVAGFGLQAVAFISLISLAAVMFYLRRHYLAMQMVEREHARAEFLAMHDPLTQLPNRHLLADRLRQALLRWERSGASFALLMIDLDHFKEVNDTYGHQGGDEVLKTLARRILGALRATDTVARYGGDEFIVLVAEVVDENDARSIGEKILLVAAEPILLGDARLRLTCSLGVALCPRDGADLDALVRQADRAMYRVKSTGRNGLCSEANVAPAVAASPPLVSSG